MKRIIAIFIILFSFLAVFSNNNQQQPKAHHDSSITDVTIESIDSKVPNNTKNNYLNANSNQTQNDNSIKILSVIVGIISLIVAILGVTSFFQKDPKNKTTKRLQDKISELDNSIKEQQKTTAKQIQILKKNNELLYISLKDIAKENKSYNLLNTITHNYYISNLYSSCISSEIEMPFCKNSFDLFAYLMENGTENDITHLKFFIDNCSDNNLKSRADNVIGAINERAKNHRTNNSPNN